MIKKQIPEIILLYWGLFLENLPEIFGTMASMTSILSASGCSESGTWRPTDPKYGAGKGPLALWGTLLHLGVKQKCHHWKYHPWWQYRTIIIMIYYDLLRTIVDWSTSTNLHHYIVSIEMYISRLLQFWLVPHILWEFFGGDFTEVFAAIAFPNLRYRSLASADP